MIVVSFENMRRNGTRHFVENIVIQNNRTSEITNEMNWGKNKNKKKN